MKGWPPPTFGSLSSNFTQVPTRWHRMLKNVWFECVKQWITQCSCSFSSHFAYDWQSCESESRRNQRFHHCQTYWRLYRLFAANKYLAECSYCTSKPRLLRKVVDDNWRCTSANHKHGHTFTDECGNSWRVPTPLFGEHVRCTTHGCSFTTLW